MRVHHYLKNILVFAPAFFAKQIFEFENILKLLYGFLIFSLVCSVLYIINDINDIDKDKIHPKTGNIIKNGGKMFKNGKFRELKGSQFDKDMKLRFINFFSRKQSFELYYIKISNKKLTDQFCENTARVFNYTLKLALEFFINKNYLPNENCSLQLDERNEKTETKYFLENYLNTELSMNGTVTGKFKVEYFDSANNSLIQIADVFANIYYSHLQTGAYNEEIKNLIDKGILKFTFIFPH